MNAQKPDAPGIESFLATLASTLSLDPTCAWWPGYLFHTTELLNAVAILESGQLLSRADAGGSMAWDNANAEIIGHTPDWVKRMARFYFRPRTPTSYAIEGFRTLPNRDPHAYCPLPIMYIFPALPILTAHGTWFSSGNCSTRDTQFGADAEFFRSLAFADIYHDRAWQSQEAERIRHHRQAEVLVPSPLDIRRHRFQIRVRSIAERETLLSLLHPATADRFRNAIQVSSKAQLFFKRWTYIESVQALGNSLTIRFNESTQDKNEFQIRMTFSTSDGQQITVHEGPSFTIQPLRLTISSLNPEQTYHLRIELDDFLAYSRVLDPRPRQLVQPRQ